MIAGETLTHQDRIWKSFILLAQPCSVWQGEDMLRTLRGVEDLSFLCVCVCVCIYVYIYMYRHGQNDWYPSVKERKDPQSSLK